MARPLRLEFARALYHVTYQQDLSAAYESIAFCNHRRAADKRYLLGGLVASPIDKHLKEDMVVRKNIVITTATLAILLLSGCGPSPADNARRNFLDSFGQISGVLRIWNCDGGATKGKDAEVVRCEYMIHGGYVNTMVKYCSTKAKVGCGYNEKGER